MTRPFLTERMAPHEWAFVAAVAGTAAVGVLLLGKAVRVLRG